MRIPTEPIGSIPRPRQLLEAVSKVGGTDPSLESLYDEATRDTIQRFEATGSPVISDGEQRKYHNFWTYGVHGLDNVAPDGFKIPFSAGALSRFSAEERRRIGVHTCPGSDCDSTHSGDVDYAELLPSLFELRAGNFYIAFPSATTPPPAATRRSRRSGRGCSAPNWPRKFSEEHDAAR